MLGVKVSSPGISEKVVGLELIIAFTQWEGSSERDTGFAEHEGVAKWNRKTEPANLQLARYEA